MEILSSKGYRSKEIASENICPAKVSLSGVSNFLELKAEKDPKLQNRKTRIEFKITDRKYPNPEEENSLSETWFKITESNNKNNIHTFIGTRDKKEVDNKTFLIVDNDKTIIAENIRACLMKNTFFRNNFSITIPYTWDGVNVKDGTTIVIESLGTGALYNFEVGFPEKPKVEEPIEESFGYISEIPTEIPIGEPTEKPTETPTEKPTDDPTEEPADSDYDNTSAINSPFWERVGESDESQNDDMIDKGMGNQSIEVDVYKNTGVFLGMPDHPDNAQLGSFLTTLTKSYSGNPIWFDINALMSTDKVYSNEFLKSGITTDSQKTTWVDAGTMSNVRLIARTNNGVQRETFYYSNVLYIITGYARTLDEVNMGDYTFGYDYFYTHLIKPLTNQPILTHITGQSQYFNFIFSDDFRDSKSNGEKYNLGIFYEFYTQSGQLICTKRSLMQSKDLFAEVNTVKLDIDEMIAQVEAQQGNQAVGLVRVGLCDDMNVASKMVDYKILPSCLHKVNDFAFLNALGGWSSFNFPGEKSVTSKAEATTFYKTLQPKDPQSTRIESVSRSIESVFDNNIKETYSVKTAPITAEVADWLKELSASVAVYELSTSRYVVIDDFDVKHTTKDDLFILEMKYHYSDTYNAVIK